jgi:ribosomal protein L14E/L6E/L27E
MFYKKKILRVWNVKANSDIINNRGNWNHLQIIQQIPDQRSGKARHQGTTENSHAEHCAHTSESSNVKVQNVYHGK